MGLIRPAQVLDSERTHQLPNSHSLFSRPLRKEALWILAGPNAASIPSAVDTRYEGSGYTDRIQIGVNGNPGEVIIQLPGKYFVSHTTRFLPGGNATYERACYIDHYRGTVFQGRVASMSVFPAVQPNEGQALSCAGLARLKAGDMLRAHVFQASGVSLTLSDSFKELKFSGAWLGS